MPTEWYLMTRPLYNSGFEGDELMLFGQDGFEEVLESSVADNIEIYEKRMNTEPLLTRAIVQGAMSDSYNNSVLRQFLCRIGTLRSGQYVKVRNQLWLVYSQPDHNGVYEKAVAWQCKYSIRFISPLTGDVVEYPVYDINSTQYGSGETEKKQMTIGSAHHLIYIPYNEETIKIDSGFRFLIDKNREHPTAYRLAQVDPSSYSCGELDGLIQWTVVESQFDEKTDNRELMVADYYGKSEQEEVEDPVNEYRLVVTPESKDGEVVFGERCRVSVVLEHDGIAVDSALFRATITDGSEYGCLDDIGTDYFVVRALNNRSYIGHEITVLIECEDYALTEQIILRIKGWY